MSILHAQLSADVVLEQVVAAQAADSILMITLVPPKSHAHQVTPPYLPPQWPQEQMSPQALF